MPIADPYASAEEYRAWKDITGAQGDAVLTMALRAVSRVLDRKLNQPYGFNRDEDDEPSTHIYRARDPFIPIADTTGLVVKTAYWESSVDWDDQTALTIDTDFALTPRSPAPGWPYTGMQLFAFGQQQSIINIGTYRGTSEIVVRTVGIHGWPEVPDGIKLATLELTAMLQGQGIFATGRISESLESVVDASPQARSVLASLSRVYNPYPVVIA